MNLGIAHLAFIRSMAILRRHDTTNLCFPFFVRQRLVETIILAHFRYFKTITKPVACVELRVRTIRWRHRRNDCSEPGIGGKRKLANPNKK